MVSDLLLLQLLNKYCKFELLIYDDGESVDYSLGITYDYVNFLEIDLTKEEFYSLKKYYDFRVNDGK